jgi:hypothetical protein
MQHEQLMTRLRGLLREAIELRYAGTLHTKKVQAQAYADGYMRALTDTDQVGDAELLRVVGEERSRFDHRAATRGAQS